MEGIGNLTWEMTMTIELTVTTKGQVTLRQAVQDHLGIRPGAKVSVSMLPDGRVELASVSAGHDLRDVRGMLRRRRQHPVALEEMREAIEAGRR
jgi:bifunctional DNA-binding transcriptional regulator/antitoxin component of YhaV-PrlF toxin-antitoxin module